MDIKDNNNASDDKVYDIAIVGTGPGGLSAAVYAARYRMDTVIIGNQMGGMIAEAHRVCNFPSYVEISGMDFTQKLVEQVKFLKVPVIVDFVTDIKKEDNIFNVSTQSKTYKAKKVILALGSEKRKQNVPGEKEFLGKGVSYCATCDGAFFRDKVVAVTGGSDSALTAALLLADFAEKVYIIYRRDKFYRGQPAWVSAVEENPKIECLFETNLKEIRGSMLVESLLIETKGDEKELPVDGIFVEIGSIPNTKLAETLGIELENNFIKTDKYQKTNINGVFAAGDVTNNAMKQLITAAAEGAVAVSTAYKEIMKDE
ncbi:MAG: NAD(P)/FAD-dependent oxidoreductase [Candidatus Woesearchaeota archaeon]